MDFPKLIAPFLAAMIAATAAHAIDEARVHLDDPYKTGIFPRHQKKILGDPAAIRFDRRVIVRAPKAAEDSFNVPVLVDATAVGDVKRIVMFVDYGPIPKILTFWPGTSAPKFAFRFKIDQATPIRAAVETKAGTWHIGHTHIDAGGGGCTAPAQAYAAADWESQLGKVNGAVWPERNRLRVVIDHPMDTGLADNIPMFIIENVRFTDAGNKLMARFELHEPVNEDPAFTVYFPDGVLRDRVRVQGRDNNGNDIDAILRARVTQ